MAIKKEILDELLKDKDPKKMFSSDGLLGELKKALAERVLNAEMDHHLADSTQDEVRKVIRLVITATATARRRY
jgi:putative transposase